MKMDRILKYQEYDREIRNLNKESSSMQEKQVMQKMISFVKDAQFKSVELEKQAKKVVDDYNKTKEEYEQVLKNIQNLIDGKSQNKDTANLINTYSSDLYMLERKLNMIVNSSKDILKKFGIAKTNVLKAKQMHSDCKAKYDSKINEIKPKIEKIREEQKKLESEIDKDVLTKYKNVLHDNIFPVIVPANGNCCGACRIEIPMGKMDKLKNDGFIVCEQCGRFIYTK